MDPYNMPTVEVAHPGAAMDRKARDHSTAPLTPEDLASYQRRGRLHALLVMLGALGLLAFNHYTAVHEHRIWPKAIYGGAMLLVARPPPLLPPPIISRPPPRGEQVPPPGTPLLVLAMALGAG